jgi:site-specific DNA recombinase
MKIADLYIRVSTDEQADKGYSQRNQEEMLQKYCAMNGIAVRKVVYEDHSAKTFNRPQWKALLLHLKRYKGKSDLVLFLKWDRFSRNAGDAYQMINTLRKLGVDPQAIEQPLDMSVPENKMMLAFYLAAPEVENDRRALNVIHGMRRARKEGRYMGKSPYGYINKSDEMGRKYIAINEPQAKVLRWAFEEIAKGVFNTEQIYLLAREKGFTGVKSLFWFAIRNPVYCGKIFVPKYKDEESSYVKAQHEPIVTEYLFEQVQDVLDGRKRKYLPKVESKPTLPLRGFLVCPECGKILSGSVSKGKRLYYSYYHCFAGCSYRLRAEGPNDQFVAELKKYIPREDALDIYKVALQDAWLSQTSHLYEERTKIKQAIKEIKDKLLNMADLVASKKMEPDDFGDLKILNAKKMTGLNGRLQELNLEHIDIEDLLETGIDNLMKLEYAYEVGDIDKKREIIAAVFPDKLHIENGILRTPRVNEAMRYIYLMESDLSKNKKGQVKNKFGLSSQVGVAGFEPTTSTSQMWRDTGLRYTPIGICFVVQMYILKQNNASFF